MNIKRGLFRIWAVLSIIFIICAAVILWDHLHGIFKAAAEDTAMIASPNVGFPITCGNARGKLGADYNLAKEAASTYSADDECIFRLDKFRPLYPEYNDLNDEDLVRLMYAKFDRPLMDYQDAWQRLVMDVAVVVIVPLLVLALGAGFYWALSGFRNPRKEVQATDTRPS